MSNGNHSIPGPVDQEPFNPEQYTPYYAIMTEHGRIGVVICLRCGATIILDLANAPGIHNKWHEEIKP